MLKPASQAGNGTNRQQVDDLLLLEVHQHGAVALMRAPGPVIDAEYPNVVALRRRGDRLQLAENRVWACVDADVTEEAHGRPATEHVTEPTHELSGTRRVPRSPGCKQRNLFGEDYPRARRLAAAEAPDP
jgi:hypothetical protein